MRYAARCLAGIGLAGLLGGCDSVWALYESTYQVCDPDDPTLVLCLTFEGQVVDGSRNALQTTGGPVTSFVPGMVGQAGHFDMQTPNVGIGDGPAWALNDFSFEAWVPPDQLPTESLQRFALVDRPNAFSVFLYTNPTTGDLALRCVAGGVTLLGLQIPLHTFSHIACVFDRSGTEVLYLNGEPMLSSMTSLTQIEPGPFTTFVGSNVQGSMDMEPDYLVGALDELRIFSGARTPEQIRASYARGGQARR